MIVPFGVVVKAQWKRRKFSTSAIWTMTGCGTQSLGETERVAHEACAHEACHAGVARWYSTSVDVVGKPSTRVAVRRSPKCLACAISMGVLPCLALCSQRHIHGMRDEPLQLRTAWLGVGQSAALPGEDLVTRSMTLCSLSSFSPSWRGKKTTASGRQRQHTFLFFILRIPSQQYCFCFDKWPALEQRQMKEPFKALFRSGYSKRKKKVRKKKRATKKQTISLVRNKSPCQFL